jgi:hypothetical protein
VSFLSQSGKDVVLGKYEKSTAYRFYADFGDYLTLGIIRNDVSNPYAWISGIEEISTRPGIERRGNEKWGLVARWRIQ